MLQPFTTSLAHDSIAVVALLGIAAGAATFARGWSGIAASVALAGLVVRLVVQA
jgi:hypothetical protein